MHPKSEVTLAMNHLLSFNSITSEQLNKVWQCHVKALSVASCSAWDVVVHNLATSRTLSSIFPNPNGGDKKKKKEKRKKKR